MDSDVNVDHDCSNHAVYFKAQATQQCRVFHRWVSFDLDRSRGSSGAGSLLIWIVLVVPAMPVTMPPKKPPRKAGHQGVIHISVESNYAVRGGRGGGGQPRPLGISGRGNV